MCFQLFVIKEKKRKVFLIDLILQSIIVLAQRQRFEEFFQYEQRFFELNFGDRLFVNSWHQPQSPPPTYDRSSSPYAHSQSPSYSPEPPIDSPRSPSPFVPNREEFDDDDSTVDFDYENYQANRDNSDDDVQVIEQNDENEEVQNVEVQEVDLPPNNDEVQIVEIHDVDLLLDNNGEHVMVNPSIKLPICSICLHSWMENRPMRAPCGHIFCSPCLRRMFNHQKQCPNCKKRVANFNQCLPCFP